MAGRLFAVVGIENVVCNRMLPGGFGGGKWRRGWVTRTYCTSITLRQMTELWDQPIVPIVLVRSMEYSYMGAKDLGGGRGSGFFFVFSFLFFSFSFSFLPSLD
jgi:hypothetical protein